MTVTFASSAPATPGTLAVGFVVINVAVIGLFGGILWYLVALNRRSDRQRAGASNPTTISRLPDGRVVPAALVGVAEAGSRGVLSSPVTRTPCVWYRVELYQRSTDATALISASARSTVKKVRVLTSEGTVRVVDDTGVVLVGPGDIAPDPEWLADTRKTGRRPKPGELFLHADNGALTDGYEQREYVIPVDARVTVIGELSRHGERLVRGADVPEFIVARKSPAQAAAASVKGGRTIRQAAWALGVVGLLGLVFGNGLMVYAMNVAG